MCKRVCSLRVIYCCLKRAWCALVCKDLWSSVSLPLSGCCLWWRLNLLIKSIPHSRRHTFHFNRRERERERDFPLLHLSSPATSVESLIVCRLLSLPLALPSWSSLSNDTLEYSPLSLCVMTDRPSACDWAEEQGKYSFSLSLFLFSCSLIPPRDDKLATYHLANVASPK